MAIFEEVGEIMNFNRIIVIGFRCVGKSIISTKLAKLLDFECLNMDTMIERQEGMSIAKITNDGKNWREFREIETLKLKELLSFNNVVISAGGGVGVNNIKYNDMLTYGEIQKKIIKDSVDTLKILLYSDANVIRKRIKNRKKIKPDLEEETFNEEEYVEENIRIMKEREKDYKDMADIMFNTNSKDVNKNVNEIMKLINQKIKK